MKRGFTLAEVLITLAIVGVIAALTIPNLMVKYQKHVALNNFKESFSELSQAIKMAESEKEPLSLTLIKNDTSTNDPDSKKCLNYFQSYMKNSTIGGHPYLHGIVRNLAGNDSIGGIFWDSPYVLTTARGSYISCAASPWGYLDFLIQIDTNGKQGPNMKGKDIFDLAYVSGKGLSYYPVTGAYITKREQALNYCSKGPYGGDDRAKRNQGCAALIILDNWQIKDDYPW